MLLKYYVISCMQTSCEISLTFRNLLNLKLCLSWAVWLKRITKTFSSSVFSTTSRCIYRVSTRSTNWLVFVLHPHQRVQVRVLGFHDALQDVSAFPPVVVEALRLLRELRAWEVLQRSRVFEVDEGRRLLLFLLYRGGVCVREIVLVKINDKKNKVKSRIFLITQKILI